MRDVEGEDFYSAERAAEVLELTPGRIRQMLRSGDLEGVPPGGEGRDRGWKIPAVAVEELLRRRPPRREQEAAQPDARAELVDELRDRVRSLEHQLDRERDANQENRRIIAGLVQRVPELEAPSSPSEPAGGPESAAEGPAKGTEPGEREAGIQRRSWWRRAFGGG